MRHLVKGRTLNRTPTHLLALKRNMANQLFAHERIGTTLPKAKELRSFVEKLITLAKKGSDALARSQTGTEAEKKKAAGTALHARRRLIAALGDKRSVIVKDKVSKKDESIDVIKKLMNEIGPRYQNRPGGYTRIIKRTDRRLGDASLMAYIELLSADDPGRSSEKKKKADS